MSGLSRRVPCRAFACAVPPCRASLSSPTPPRHNLVAAVASLHRKFSSRAPTDAAANRAGGGKYSLQHMRALPKAELHIHLDGSLRLDTLLDLAQQDKVSLPPLPGRPKLPQHTWTPELLKQQVFLEHYSSLVEYLKGFTYCTSVLQTPHALERVGYEFVQDQWAEGVCYVEARFAPQLCAHEHLSIGEVLAAVDKMCAHERLSIREGLAAVDKGMRRAVTEINANVSEPGRPPMDFGIIVCAMRHFGPQFSRYYRAFCNVLGALPKPRLAGLASLVLVSEAVVARDQLGCAVVGVDISGAEDGFPASDHKEAFALARKHFLHATVHAGEAYGAESIYSAITDLYTSRVGHGFHLFDTKYLKDPSLDSEEKKKGYIEKLVTFCGEANITFEVCLTSNVQTMPWLQEDLSKHSLRLMLAKGLNVTLNSDNTLVSNTNASKELKLAVDTFKLSDCVRKEIVLNGFRQSFMSDYQRQRRYTRAVEQYYDKVEARFAAMKTTMGDSDEANGFLTFDFGQQQSR